jgi:hypothetical protein
LNRLVEPYQEVCNPLKPVSSGMQHGARRDWLSKKQHPQHQRLEVKRGKLRSRRPTLGISLAHEGSVAVSGLLVLISRAQHDTNDSFMLSTASYTATVS